MATFFVGQRVRVVHPFHPEYYGLTGRLTALFPERQSIRYVVNCDVDWDRLPANCLSVCHTSRLEPILPDHQACDDDFKRDLDRLLERQGIAA
jgi:hypothetical protein